MTPEQINIAIAQHNGWEIKNGSVVTLSTGESLIAPLWFHDEHAPDGWDILPDYCNDLNAMHEVEKTLTPEQEEDYVDRLGEAVMQTAYEDDKRWMESNLSSFDSTYRATARQRAEAYLRTIGKWKK